MIAAVMQQLLGPVLQGQNGETGDTTGRDTGDEFSGLIDEGQRCARPAKGAGKGAGRGTGGREERLKGGFCVASWKLNRVRRKQAVALLAAAAAGGDGGSRRDPVPF